MKRFCLLMVLVANAQAGEWGKALPPSPPAPLPLAGEGSVESAGICSLPRLRGRAGERADHCGKESHSAWGRLFFYPPKPELPPVASEPARFDGVLEGRSKTYWVDGVATRRAPPAQVKPGEAWDRQSGAPQSGPRLRQP